MTKNKLYSCKRQNIVNKKNVFIYFVDFTDYTLCLMNINYYTLYSLNDQAVRAMYHTENDRCNEWDIEMKRLPFLILAFSTV